MTLLDETMGPLFIGVLVGGILWGVSCSQVYFYFTRYHRDPLYMKLLVAAVWTTDTAHQALISHSLYWYLITNYGDPNALALLAPTIIVEVLIQAFTGIMVQSFFAGRVYRLSGKKWFLTVPVICLIIIEFSVSMAYTIKALRFSTFAQLVEIKDLSIMINAFAAAGDVAIAGILCTILQVSKTGFQRSTMLINKLMIFSVNTGLLTSICACMSLITILALPNTFVYITFFFIIGRLYANSLMATLNARKGLRDGTSQGHDTSLSLQNMHPTVGTANISKRDHGTRIAIQIDTTKDTSRDADNEVHTHSPTPLLHTISFEPFELTTGADQYQASLKYGSQDKHSMAV